MTAGPEWGRQEEYFISRAYKPLLDLVSKPIVDGLNTSLLPHRPSECYGFTPDAFPEATESRTPRVVKAKAQIKQRGDTRK